MSSVAQAQIPLKRKRGRPRKNPANSSAPPLPFNRHGDVISLTDDTPTRQPKTQANPTPNAMVKPEPELQTKAKPKPKQSLAEPFLETPVPRTNSSNRRQTPGQTRKPFAFDNILSSPPPLPSPSLLLSRHDLQIFVDPPKSATTTAATSEEMPPPQTPRRTTTHATLYNELSPFNAGRNAAVDPSMLFHEFISTSPLLYSSAFSSSPASATAVGWSPKGPSTPKTFASIMQSSPLYQGFYSSPVQSNSPSNVPRLVPMSMSMSVPSKRQRLAAATFPKLDFESLVRQKGASAAAAFSTSAPSGASGHGSKHAGKHHTKRRKLDLKSSSISTTSATRLVYQSPDRLPTFAARSGGVLVSPRTLRSSPMRSPMAMVRSSPIRSSTNTPFCPDKLNLDFKRGISMSLSSSPGGGSQYKADENRPEFVTPRKRTLVPGSSISSTSARAGGFAPSSPSPSKYSRLAATPRSAGGAGMGAGKRRISLSVSETGKAAVIEAVNFGFSDGDRFGGPVLPKRTSAAPVSVLGDVDLQTQNLETERHFESSDDEEGNGHVQGSLEMDVENAKAALTSSASKLRWKLACAQQLTSSTSLAATSAPTAPSASLLTSSPSAVSTVSSYATMDQFSVATPMTSPMQDRHRSSPRSISSPYRKLHISRSVGGSYQGQPRDLASSFPAVTPRRLTIAHGDDSEGETDIEDNENGHHQHQQRLQGQKGVVGISKNFRPVVDAREAFHRAMLSSQVLLSASTLASIKKEPVPVRNGSILRTFSSFGHELEFDLDSLNTGPGGSGVAQQPQVVTQFEDLFGGYETSTF